MRLQKENNSKNEEIALSISDFLCNDPAETDSLNRNLVLLTEEQKKIVSHTEQMVKIWIWWKKVLKLMEKRMED